MIQYFDGYRDAGGAFSTRRSGSRARRSPRREEARAAFLGNFPDPRTLFVGFLLGVIIVRACRPISRRWPLDPSSSIS